MARTPGLVAYPKIESQREPQCRSHRPDGSAETFGKNREALRPYREDHHGLTGRRVVISITSHDNETGDGRCYHDPTKANDDGAFHWRGRRRGHRPVRAGGGEGRVQPLSTMTYKIGTCRVISRIVLPQRNNRRPKGPLSQMLVFLN